MRARLIRALGGFAVVIQISIVAIMEKSDKAATIYFYGRHGEAIFDDIEHWRLPPNAMKQIQSKLLAEMEHVSDLGDDRLLVLVGALVIENAVDELLTAIMPGFKKLRDKKDFTFSMRIDLARALKLIPARILNCSDCIRKIRNEFAHNLSIRTFGDLDIKVLRPIHDRLPEYLRVAISWKDEPECFRLLVQFTALSLYVYRIHVEHLNGFLRSPFFLKALKTTMDAGIIPPE